MLKKINNEYYFYTDKETNITFQLRYNEIGVYGSGRCWSLSALIQNQKNIVYTYIVKDDGHQCYKRYGGQIWDSMQDILESANSMIFDMTTP